jgi:hypothetical protein
MAGGPQAREVDGRDDAEVLGGERRANCADMDVLPEEATALMFLKSAIVAHAHEVGRRRAWDVLDPALRYPS